MWIGVEKQSGKLECDQPEDCLTKCYSKPEHKESCKSDATVYLKCGKCNSISVVADTLWTFAKLRNIPFKGNSNIIFDCFIRVY